MQFTFFENYLIQIFEVDNMELGILPWYSLVEIKNRLMNKREELLEVVEPDETYKKALLKLIFRRYKRLIKKLEFRLQEIEATQAIYLD